MKLLSVSQIWQQAEHNAFTSLARFKGNLFCVFREGSAHVSPDGSVRVLRSTDEGKTWQSVAVVSSELADLRDPKLVLYRDRLMLLSGGNLLDGGGLQSFVWQSPDGCHWSKAEGVADRGYWLWSITAHRDSLYGVAYRSGPDSDVRLYLSDDGRHFEPWVPMLCDEGYVNEASLLFSSDDGQQKGACYCLLRRDPLWGPESLALLGRSLPPYKQWQWLTLDRRVGGPILFQYGERLLAVVRLYDGHVRTSLVEIDPDGGQLHELLALPSGGDTSYAGVLLEGDSLMVSYYSAHETQASLDERQANKTKIYFAKITLA